MNNSKNTGLLQLENIVVKFGELTALNHISLDVKKGEIHAIVGEHGAGKSSLGLLTSGFIRPASGMIRFKGRELSPLSPETARQSGIEIVTQHNPLFDDFTVANNILVNNRFRSSPFFNSKQLKRTAGQFLQATGFDLDPSALLKNLNQSDRVVVDILKHIYPQPELLILDEALEKLSAENLERIIAILRAMKQKGTAILFITHRIDDIYTFADRVSIMRDGHILLTDSVDRIDKINIIRLAYTQFLQSERGEQDTTLFYQLLKYNQAILENLPINLIVIDENGSVKLINESAKHFFSATLSSEPGDIEALFSTMPKQITDGIADSIREKKEQSFYQVPIRFGKSQVITNIQLLPIFDGNLFLGTILIIEDITEQEKLREQVILSENLSSVGLLAAGVAHEINNPLEIIYNHIQGIRFETGNKALLEKIDQLEEEVSGISQIVSNLITFSDSRKSSIEEFNLVELLEQLIGLITYNARYKNIDIAFMKSSDRVPIKANKTEIKQAILNIMKNSFEAMPDGGTLTIRTETVPVNGFSEARIQFTDTGPGIREERIQSIFLPFFSTKDGPQQNMGLGLSISYGIIKKYRGAITVKNVEPPSTGCTFTVKIPV